MIYRRCGRSGLQLPAISLGLWQGFGGSASHESVSARCRRAFDLGITHFDLANNYGPPPGSAEANFGEVLRRDFRTNRDEILISSKAGYHMWDGPYGSFGSRKHLIASCDQSLARLGLDYVDIFYSHRFDPDTPLEETMGALAHLVQSGKALYVGLSNYPVAAAVRGAKLLQSEGTPCLILQPRYSILDQQVEKEGLFVAAAQNGIGTICYSPLSQGLLSDRYLSGDLTASRASATGRLAAGMENEAGIERLRALAQIAEARGQTLAQMALAWVLRRPEVTSALVGASRPEQIELSVGALSRLDFGADELAAIDRLAFLAEDW
ncbi:aldo/keto reductase [Frigidibacter sp. RF13]|uniref:aldo/keto reductase n=1 Tax=Frigidibacter sp. RF13 TaxID=2997340 RepID=UPI00226D42FD|nr:aldo/keto reductase [Frigidibacter sp. RF13]MCY1125310.1 aldo/keto reductase [Frigidibacter sp. RF13]